MAGNKLSWRSLLDIEGSPTTGFYVTIVDPTSGLEKRITLATLLGLGGGGGAVSSVFSRTGAVVATLGDYAASLISDDSVWATANVKAALDAINTTFGSYQALSGKDAANGYAGLDASQKLSLADVVNTVAIEAAAVTLAKMESRGDATFIGRASGAGIGAPQELTAAQARTILNVEDGAAADQSAAEVPFAPDGDIVATDVQAAVVEVRNDTDTKLATKSDSGHTHGVTDIAGVNTDRLLGRDTAGVGAAEEITVGNGLEFNAGGIRRSALTGDVTASAGSNATTIANSAVTLAKMADLAAARVIGRASGAGTGVPTALTGAQLASIIGTVSSSAAGVFPQSNLGASADPTTGDDTGDGYSVGSLWLNTTDDTAFICVDATASAAVWLELGAGGGGFPTFEFDASELWLGNIGAWPVTVAPGSDVDDVDSELGPNLLFDDTANEGAGFKIQKIPAGATNIIIDLLVRPLTGPTGSATSIWRAYGLGWADGEAPGSFSSAQSLTTITHPTTTKVWKRSTTTIALSSLGLAAGDAALIQIESNGGTLTDDRCLRGVNVTFS